MYREKIMTRGAAARKPEPYPAYRLCHLIEDVAVANITHAVAWGCGQMLKWLYRDCLTRLSDSGVRENKHNEF